MSFDTPVWMQNDSYSARLDRQVMSRLIADPGVLDMTAMKVSQRGAGANLSVDIAVGAAVINGGDQTDQGSYLVNCTAIENKAIAAAPGSNSRYDLVYVRVNDPNATGPAGDNASFGVVTGTASASPAVPALPTSAIPLAIVGPILTSTSAITNAMIADARLLAGRIDRPGAIEWRAGASVPNGWLLCAGQAVSRTTYARLFAEIGVTHGAGNGTTTFNVPDLRGRTAFGLDNMGGSDAGNLSVANTLGGTGGVETVTIGTANLPPHAHTIDHDHNSVPVKASGSDVYVGGNVSSSGGMDQGVSGSGGFPMTVDLPNFTGNSGNGPGSSTAMTNMPPYMLLNALIRT